MKKPLVFLAIFLFSVNLSAQDRPGYIKPNFGIGYCSEGNIDEPKGSFAISVDINFVLNFGLTFGVSDVLAFSSQPVINIPSIGIGYTWDDKRNYLYSWDAFPSIGIKFIVMPVLNGAFGGEINITKWIGNDIGLSAIFNIVFYEDIYEETKTIFLLKFGYTMKL